MMMISGEPRCTEADSILTRGQCARYRLIGKVEKPEG
jgi:hypothetical protein